MTVKYRGLARLVGFSAQQMNRFKRRGYIPNLTELDERYIDVLRLVKEKLDGGYRLSVAFKEAKEQYGVDDKAISLNARYITHAELVALFNIDQAYVCKISRGKRERFSYESALQIALAWVLHSAGAGPDESKRFANIYGSRGPIHGGNLITVVDGRIIENPFSGSAARETCLVYAIVNIGATIQRIDDVFGMKERHHAVIANGVTAGNGLSPA